MNKIKAILFDVDDTIYSHKLKRIPELTKKTLRALKEKGYYLGVCTSRFPREFYSLPQDDFKLFDMIIAGTGSIYIQNDEIIRVEKIEQDSVNRYMNYFKKNPDICYLWTELNGNCYFNKEPHERTKNHHSSWSGGCPEIKEYNGEELCNIIYYYVSDTQTQEIIDLADEGSLERWDSCGHLNPKGINKAYGLKNFCKHFNLSLDEIVCFGDGKNDISMIEMAGIGIAVGNGHEELKQHADYVCESIENGGIYHMCVELGLIEPIDTKIFFFDIDSTTYLHRIHDNPASTKLAFKKLKENGYKLYICTSRSYEEMSELPKDFLDVMDGIACLGGAHLILDGKHQMITMDHDEVKQVLQYLDEKNIIYRYCTSDGHGYLNRFDQEKHDLFYRLYQMVPPIKKYENEEVTHILYYVKDEEDVKKTNEILKNSSVVRLNLSSEATPYNIDKASAIENVVKHYGYTLENAVSFGDGRNDISMLLAAGIGIAMGNAHEDCKNIADYVTDAIDEDGLYNACVRFKWIEK